MSVRIAALWSMGAQYCAFLIQFVTSVIISRFFLDPAEVGLFSIALAAAMVIQVVQDFGITRFVSGEAELTRTQAQSCTTISFALSWIIALVIFAAAYPLALFYGDPRLAWLLVIIGASYLICPFSTVPVALLVRDMDYQRLFFIYAGAPLAGGIAALWLASAGYSASALAWAMIVQAAARALIAQKFRPLLPRWPVSRDEAKPIVGFGSSSFILSVSSAIGMRSQDLIVGRLISLDAVGLYSRATALAGQLAVLMTGAINGVFYPAFRRLRDEGAELGAPYIRVVAGNTGINWAAMAGLSVAAEPLVLLLYGEKWSGAAELLRWTALAEMCFVAIPLHMDMPILLGRIKTLIRLNILDTVAAVSLLAIGSSWGVVWAAIARLGYGIIWIFIYIRFQHSLLHFSWRSILEVYLKSAITALAAVVPMLCMYQFWRAPEDFGFGGLLIGAGLGVMSWLAALYAVRHPAADEVSVILDGILAKLGLQYRLS